jgi:hypothetical protein
MILLPPCILALLSWLKHTINWLPVQFSHPFLIIYLSKGFYFLSPSFQVLGRTTPSLGLNDGGLRDKFPN